MYRGSLLAWARVVESEQIIPLTVGTTCSAASNISLVISRVSVAVPLWNVTAAEVTQIK